MKRNIAKPFIVLVFLFSAFCCMPTGANCRAEEAHLAVTPAPAGDNSTKPLVVYYSRTGNGRLLATALKNRLGCDIAEIQSKRNRNVFIIMCEQWFGLNDKQEPLSLDPAGYNPIIIVSPIYFMRLSGPARTFLDNNNLEGKDAYIFTTSGGPLAGFSAKWIRSIAAEHGMKAQAVTGFQISKKTPEGKSVLKTQEDFDQDVKALLEKTPVISAARQ
jgi:flavodoxin